MNIDLTSGNITKRLLLFAFPLMLGNIFQQFYNIADTFIVGKYIGNNALAATGSSYALMIFLTSVLLGLSMGSGAYFSVQFGRRNEMMLRNSVFISFIMIAVLTSVMTVSVYALRDPIIRMMNVPEGVTSLMRSYLTIIIIGIPATFIYNFFASLLRAVGNSSAPLVFLSVSVIMNIILDIIFIAGLNAGIEGAAAATVISQYSAASGLTVFTVRRFPGMIPGRADIYFDRDVLKAVLDLSLLTSLQQSVMNFGILLVQGLVNSFGASVMAAFAVATKIDTLAYMPVQDFGNAFSTFTAQNFGAGNSERIKKGIRSAFVTSILFCAVISSIVFIFAEPLMKIFVDSSSIDVIKTGAEYLRIEGSFYAGIGMLFLFYGFFRAVDRPAISLILTIVSLGTRVLISYTFSRVPLFGYHAIWFSIPIGWFLSDALGYVFLRRASYDISRR